MKVFDMFNGRHSEKRVSSLKHSTISELVWVVYSLWIIASTQQ